MGCKFDKVVTQTGKWAGSKTGKWVGSKTGKWGGSKTGKWVGSASKVLPARLLQTVDVLKLVFPVEGHNWGSEHDADTKECSPNSGSGGKYIMYTYSVSGYDPNNKVGAWH